MKAPKCRLCAHEHWTHEPHVFTSGRDSGLNTVTNSTPDTNRSITNSTNTGAQRTNTVTLSSGRKRNRETYNAYQREYMRKRRAG